MVVEVQGRRIAASMNGMPHGMGTILDNDFPGHFCIHFAGSTTHGSRRADPGHQLMILKASGRLAQVLDSASPAEVAALALAAAYQQDAAALRYASDRLEERLRQELFSRIEHLDIGPVRTLFAGRGTAVVAVDVTVYARPDPDRGYRLTVRLLLRRDGPPPGDPGTPAAPPGFSAGWKVRFSDLGQLLARPGQATGEEAPAPPGEGDSRPAAC